jgi:hypothetical protein
MGVSPPRLIDTNTTLERRATHHKVLDLHHGDERSVDRQQGHHNSAQFLGRRPPTHSARPAPTT